MPPGQWFPWSGVRQIATLLFLAFARLKSGHMTTPRMKKLHRQVPQTTNADNAHTCRWRNVKLHQWIKNGYTSTE